MQLDCTYRSTQIDGFTYSTTAPERTPRRTTAGHYARLLVEADADACSTCGLIVSCDCEAQ